MTDQDTPADQIPPGYEGMYAVKISAPILRTELIGEDPEIWLAFDDTVAGKDFKADDNCPVYYGSELKMLGTKTPAQLLAINEVKMAMPGSRVRE